jgi:hypothetical protein
MIDLEQTVFVNHVRIFNRDDSCGIGCTQRLDNFQIRIGFFSTFYNNPACVTGESWFYNVKNFSCVLSGRYVSLQQYNYKEIDLREMEVYGRKTSNLARACSAGGCPVTGSSDYGNTFRYLVDGNTAETAPLLHSSSVSNEWMLIVLQQTAFVNSVQAFNRKDCCKERINNFQIRVGHSSTFSNNPVSLTYELVWGNSAPGTDFARSMLDSAEAWSWTGALPEWMQIDLGSEFRVHGIVTQCRANYEQCPHEIEVQHSLTASSFVSATAVGGTTRFFLPTTWSSTLKTCGVL